MARNPRLACETHEDAKYVGLQAGNQDDTSFLNMEADPSCRLCILLKSRSVLLTEPPSTDPYSMTRHIMRLLR